MGWIYVLRLNQVELKKRKKGRWMKVKVTHWIHLIYLINESNVDVFIHWKLSTECHLLPKKRHSIQGHRINHNFIWFQCNFGDFFFLRFLYYMCACVHSYACERAIICHIYRHSNRFHSDKISVNFIFMVFME